jgi:hypothetical protein
MNFVQSSMTFARQSSATVAAMKLRSLHAWALATSLRTGGGEAVAAVDGVATVVTICALALLAVDDGEARDGRDAGCDGGVELTGLIVGR